MEQLKIFHEIILDFFETDHPTMRKFCFFLIALGLSIVITGFIFGRNLETFAYLGALIFAFGMVFLVIFQKEEIEYEHKTKEILRYIKNNLVVDNEECKSCPYLKKQEISCPEFTEMDNERFEENF
jgi:hypothetical protein